MNIAFSTSKRERTRSEARVEGDSLKLEVEERAAVQGFLDVKGYLGAVHLTIVTETNFDRKVETHIVVRVNVEGEGRGKKSGGVEVEIDLGEMLGCGRRWDARLRRGRTRCRWAEWWRDC